MKNIHILSTDEQIKNVGDVVKDLYGDIHIFTKKNEGKEYVKTITKLNIYITSDEEIKEGDWCYDSDGKQILQFNNKIVVLLANQQKEKYGVKSFFKIILTTDQDLIKDGVQAIDIEFLEWFVKNPSCEEVEIDTIETLTGSFDAKGIKSNYVNVYKIIIPKEKTKQETLEEVAERILANNIDGLKDALKDDDLFFFYKGVVQCYGEAMAKWQQEQDKNKYSEEDLKEAFAMGRLNKNIKDFNQRFKNK